MKKIKKIRYPIENENEGKIKLENLVRHYPFHFMKVYNEYKQDREFPISQIIISCKMKGFDIPSSDYYLRETMRYRGLNTDDINHFWTRNRSYSQTSGTVFYDRQTSLI